MRAKKGFTLIELLVVISIIALLVSILMPGLGRVRELANRVKCAANVSAIGKALVVYQGSNQDSFPYFNLDGNATNTWEGITGSCNANPQVVPTAATSVSSLLFMLVRDGQQISLFVCPSISTDSVDANTKDANGTYHYDFMASRCVSYSYQAPMTVSGAMVSGCSSNSDSGLVILADKTPYKNSTNANKNTATTGIVLDWSQATIADPKLGMSDNHTLGEYMNYAKVDGSTKNDSRADVGISGIGGKDNIYSQVSAPTTDETDPKGTAITVSTRTSAKDSALAGPNPN